MIPRYRAWDKEFKEMVQVNALVLDEQVIKATYKNGNIVKDDVKEYELMQSTGLFDKNGKEIFEGDIVSVGTAARVVKKNNLLGFYIEEGEKIGYFSDVVDVNCLDFFAKDFGEEAEIIGNVWEDGDLIDGKKTS